LRHGVFGELAVVIRKAAQFRHLLELARLLQSIVHRRMSRRGNKGELKMAALSSFAQQTLAAIGALAISALLFANTLATQAAEVHSVAGILA
jgi:hypothetical protein